MTSKKTPARTRRRTTPARPALRFYTLEVFIISGPVTRKVKGGLLVNIGVNVFLPASQVDIRRPSDIGD